MKSCMFPVCAGDIVGVLVGGKSPTERRLSGVVVQTSQEHISVAFDDLPDSVDLATFSRALELVKLANEVTYRRIRRFEFSPCTSM